MKKLILFLSVVCLCLASCGGESGESIDYRRYQVSSAFSVSKSQTTTQAATKNNTPLSTKNTVPTSTSVKTDAKQKTKQTNKLNIKPTNTNKAVESKTTITKSVSLNNGSVSMRSEEQPTTVTSDQATTTLAKLSDTDTAYITATGERYHRKGCYYLAKSCIAITVGTAKEKGYTPCKICKP